MFNPEELIVLTDYQMYNHEQFRPHIEIQIPQMPDFGAFEEMPREPPVLKKSLTDNLGNESHQNNNSVEQEEVESMSSVSTLSDTEDEYTSNSPEFVIINICGYTYNIITTGLTQDEIDEEIIAVENDALDYLLDGSDTRFL